MASALHEAFLWAFSKDLEFQVQSQEPRLFSVRSANIKLFNGDICSPDHWLGDGSNRFPAVVIEVGCSEKAQHLETKMKSYVHNSQGYIRLGVAIDIEYSKHSRPTAVTVTSYQPVFVGSGGLRSEKGQPTVRSSKGLNYYADTGTGYHTRRCT